MNNTVKSFLITLACTVAVGLFIWLTMTAPYVSLVIVSVGGFVSVWRITKDTLDKTPKD